MEPESQLTALAGLWDVETSYHTLDGKAVPAPRESLLAVLKALGAPLNGGSGGGSSGADVEDALRQRRRQLWGRMVEPVVVAWDGKLADVVVRVPASFEGGIECRMLLEDGGEERFSLGLEGAPTRVEDVGGVRFAAWTVGVGRGIPIGYHRLSIDAGGQHGEALVISAPRQAYTGAEATGEGRGPRPWGIFTPLYALHSRNSLGIGDLRDLSEVMQWVAGLGGGIVATLPLFATFLDQLFEPSPYSPITRRFWNEVFIDLRAVPEVAGSAEVARVLQAEQRMLQESDALTCELVDYRRVAAAKHRVLSEAARDLLSGPSARREELERFAARHPDLNDYAWFRAAVEHYQRPWQQWPADARAGRPAGAAVSEDLRNYHRYVQWIAESQLDAARRSSPAGLLLDMPLGVHPAGYDVWREHGSFLIGTTAGAPPDPLNLKGQNWGNPPLHPEGIRTSGYAYPIACTQQVMRHSRVLRIDHVMGLHRVFVIPEGAEGADGVYVRYHADEAYAILCLESHRAQAMVVGEDLGTVPEGVRPAMAQHHIHRTYVAQWGIDEPGLEPVPSDSVASINTHDMAPFASWWRGTDIEERRGLGLLTDDQAQADLADRAEQRRRLVKALVEVGLLGSDQPAEGEVLEAWLAYLARSDARLVLAALEDLWGSASCQNLPGTTDEHPNWRRRFPYPLDEVRCMPQVLGRLKTLNDLRVRPDIAEEARP